MRFARISVAILLLSSFAAAQFIDINTQAKGSRLPSWATDSGSANAYVLTTVSEIGSGGVLQTGSCFQFLPATSNTSASTANVDSTGVISIKKNISSALVAGDISGGTPGKLTEICYDGTNFQLVGNGAFGNNTVGCSQMPALTGDATSSAGSCATTLASVVTAGTCGDTTHSCGLTYDAKGRITAATNNAISGTGASGGDFSEIETHTANNTSTELDFTTCLSNSFDSYFIRIGSLTPATNSVAIRIQWSTNGGSTYDTAGNYAWSKGYNSAELSDQGNTRTTGDSGWVIGGTDVSNSTTYPGLNGYFYLFGINSSTQYKTGVYAVSYTNVTPATYDIHGAAVYKATPAVVNAFRLISSSGNLKTGTVSCYGIKN